MWCGGGLGLVAGLKERKKKTSTRTNTLGYELNDSGIVARIRRILSAACRGVHGDRTDWIDMQFEDQLPITNWETLICLVHGRNRAEIPSLCCVLQ
jgi:hypothetical protein